MPMPSCRKRPHSPDGPTTSQSGAGSSNVKVVIRVRPENEKEVGSRVVTQVMNENILVFDPKENSESGLSGSRKRPRDLRKRQNRDLTFAFDYVFGPESKTHDLYEQTTKSILTGLLNGYNCSVFAYGATGAGKTHTMLGTKEQPGVMYLTMVDLYDRIDAMKDTKTCDVAVSYLEVYNETIRDLIMPSGCLPIREDPNNGIVVPGLSLHKPKTAEELLYMLQVGNQHRTQHPTDANAESSRSHAVFQVFIRQKDRTANISTEVRIAKLCLVDLAGSERATVTKNRGSRFREGANINRSLLALGNVINALAENKNKGFIPYRDSKLTRLLKDSLGGNCQTVMIAAVSPSTFSFEDTYNTLRYADRAKNIKSTLKKNVLNVDFHIAKYGQIVEELRREIVELKQKLQDSENRPPVETPVPQQQLVQDFTGFFEEINSAFGPHLTASSEQLTNEINVRELQWKMYRKHRCLSRLAVLDESSNNETVEKIKGIVSGMNQKSEFLATKVDVSLDKLAEGSNSINVLKQKLSASLGCSDGTMPQPLSQCFQVNLLMSELQDTHKHIGYLKRSIRVQERELQHNERLVHKLLKVMKRQHYIIKGHNMMTSDLQNEYTSIQQIAAGQELQWEDQLEDSTIRPGYRLSEMLDLPCLSRKLSLPAATCSVMPVSESTVSNLHKTTRQSLQLSSSQEDCSPAKIPRVESPTAPAMVDRFRNSQTSCNGLVKPKTNFTGCSDSGSPLNTGSLMDLSQIKVDEVDDKSPEDDYVPKSKFTKINDTITKCKKSVRLHTSEMKVNEKSAGNCKSELNETFSLDGTFTMDPSSSHVPLSAVPCVDNISSAQQNICNIDKQTLPSASSCQCSKSRRNINGNFESVVSENNKQSNCDMCKCAIEPHSEIHSGSGLQSCDPNDDSGASTLINSQATVSTLRDSQNLSGFSDIVHSKCVNKGYCSSQSDNLSDTFTKDDSSYGSSILSCPEVIGNSSTKVHAARSIKFEEKDSLKMLDGRNTVVFKRTPERKPLHQVGPGNTTPNCSQPGRVPALTRSHSMVANKNSYSFKRQHSFTPSYMKITKAAAHRYEVKSRTFSVPSPAEAKTNMTHLKRFKSKFFTRKPRPLMPSMRSKSTSNLSSRAAWQF